jgi:DNA-binding beta-propeller fold protein YncE
MLRRLLFVPLIVVACATARGQFVLVSSDFNDSVQRYDLNGTHLGAFVPTGGGGLDSPQGICVGPDGNVYVSSANTDEVLRYNGQTGAPMGAFVPAGGGGLDRPWFLHFGPDNNLYVSSSLTNQVLCYNGTTGVLDHVAAEGDGLTFPDCTTFQTDGTMLVSQFFQQDSRIKRYNPGNGQFIEDVVVDSNLHGPLEHWVSADGATLFVNAYGNSAVREYSIATGAYLGNFATAPLAGPVGRLALPDGTLLITSWNNSSIYRFDANGNFLNTFATGDGLNHPNNLTLLYVPEPAIASAVLVFMIACSRRGRAQRSEAPPRLLLCVGT